LWEVPAEELLAAGDVGLVPWVPLAQFDGPPEPIVRKCRARIDQDAPPNEHETLLAVTQFLTRSRYNDPRLFQILGRRKAMIESPLLEELKAEWTRDILGGRKAVIESPLLEELKAEWTPETTIESLTDVLVARFGSKAQALETELKAIDDEARLRALIKHAATCRTLGSFRKQLSS